tara:strand:+ start:3326 stop:3631 length:306 start_codon:yes stop_codon:yes gene_type:complete
VCGQEVCADNGGICVIQFNASFNIANSVTWYTKLTDCDVSNVDIMERPDLQTKYEIVVVPTIIILENGEEVKRYQANIMMQMEATKREVQETIDEILMSSF